MIQGHKYFHKMNPEKKTQDIRNSGEQISQGNELLIYNVKKIYKCCLKLKYQIMSISDIDESREQK